MKDLLFVLDVSLTFLLFKTPSVLLRILIPKSLIMGQINSFTQPCLTLCNPIDCSTADLPVHHQLPEFTQIHAYRVDDAIQPPYPLLSPYTPTFNLSQYQVFFK